MVEATVSVALVDPGLVEAVVVPLPVKNGYQAIERFPDGVRVDCDDGRSVDASHVVLAVGSVPNSDDLGLDVAGVEADEAGYVTGQTIHVNGGMAML